MTHFSDEFEKLFPYIPKTKLAEAEQRSLRYLALVLQIYERISPENLQLDEGEIGFSDNLENPR